METKTDAMKHCIERWREETGLHYEADRANHQLNTLTTQLREAREEIQAIIKDIENEPTPEFEAKLDEIVAYAAHATAMECIKKRLQKLLSQSPTPEQPKPETDLPEVAGRTITKSIADFERSGKFCLKEEQSKINPDNGLVAFICDAIRLGREHSDAMQVKPSTEAEGE